MRKMVANDEFINSKQKILNTLIEGNQMTKISNRVEKKMNK